MALQSKDDQIACEPMVVNAIKSEVRSGFAHVEQITKVIPLKVLFGNAKFPTGSTVYLHGETIKHPFAVRKMTVDGVEFILVPVTEIVLFEAS